MHMMFVDESGDTGYAPGGKWKGWRASRLYSRVGAIIHGWKWKAWNDRLKYFKGRRSLAWDAELKASHIRRAKGAFVGWDRSRRDWFLRELLQLIGTNEDITLLGVAIDKTKVDVSQPDRMVKPEVRSMELLLERYNYFLREQRDKSGIVVLDPVQGVSDDNIRYFQSYLQAHSEHLKPLHIVEGTFFAKSHTSSMVQVADICSNVFYRRETRASGSWPDLKLIWPRFWRRGNRVAGYGVKRWPK